MKVVGEDGWSHETLISTLSFGRVVGEHGWSHETLISTLSFGSVLVHPVKLSDVTSGVVYTLTCKYILVCILLNTTLRLQR